MCQDHLLNLYNEQQAMAMWYIVAISCLLKNMYNSVEISFLRELGKETERKNIRERLKA
jgi:hypothetical protein